MVRELFVLDFGALYADRSLSHLSAPQMGTRRNGELDYGGTKC